MASDLEANFVAVERVKEYTQIEKEAARHLSLDQTLPNDWPPKGEILFEDAQLKYRPELPFVLKGMNLRIPAGSKVGVVGRTGAGTICSRSILFSLMLHSHLAFAHQNRQIHVDGCS